MKNRTLLVFSVAICLQAPFRMSVSSASSHPSSAEFKKERQKTVTPQRPPALIFDTSFRCTHWDASNQKDAGGPAPNCSDGRIPGNGGIAYYGGWYSTANITAIAVGNPAVVTTQFAHQFTTGDAVSIVSSNSTPTITGVRTVTVTDATHFTVPLNVTNAGTSGTFRHDDQITAAANMASGGGGLGLRHWICPGGGTNNCNSGSMKIAYATSNQKKAWVRVYHRYQAATFWTLLNYHKLIYWSPGVSPCEFTIFDIHAGDVSGTICGDTVHGGSVGWTSLMGSATKGDGRWHCLEYFYDVSSNPGTLKMWIDGSLKVNNSGYGGAGAASGRGYGEFTIPENEANMSGTLSADVVVDIDEIAVSVVGQIGCTYGTKLAS